MERRLAGDRGRRRLVLWGWERLVDLVYPPFCAGCDEPRHGGDGALPCPGCLARLGLVRSGARRAPPPSGCDELWFAGPYEGSLGDWVRRLKFQRQTWLAATLGAILAHGLAGRVGSLDGILHVPLASRRRRERGFDQAEAIAREVAARSGVPFVRRGLRRVRHTSEQGRLGRRERLRNVVGAFRLDPRVAATLRGGSWGLLDDVVTTGATLAGAATALASARPRRIVALVVAAAGRHGTPAETKGEASQRAVSDPRGREPRGIRSPNRPPGLPRAAGSCPG